MLQSLNRDDAATVCEIDQSMLERIGASEFSCFRIVQTDVNGAGTYNMCVNWLEIYGKLEDQGMWEFNIVQ